MNSLDIKNGEYNAINANNERSLEEGEITNVSCKVNR